VASFHWLSRSACTQGRTRAETIFMVEAEIRSWQ